MLGLKHSPKKVNSLGVKMIGSALTLGNRINPASSLGSSTNGLINKNYDINNFLHNHSNSSEINYIPLGLKKSPLEK